NAVWVVHVVAVQKQKIADGHQVVSEARRICEARAHEKTARWRIELAFRTSLSKFDQFVGTFSLDDLLRKGEIHLIPHFEEDVSRSALHQPVHDIRNGLFDGFLIPENARLFPVKQAENHDHTQRVARSDDIVQAAKVSRLYCTVGKKAGRFPRLVPTVAL